MSRSRSPVSGVSRRHGAPGDGAAHAQHRLSRPRSRRPVPRVLLVRVTALESRTACESGGRRLVSRPASLRETRERAVGDERDGRVHPGAGAIGAGQPHLLAGERARASRSHGPSTIAAGHVDRALPSNGTRSPRATALASTVRPVGEVDARAAPRRRVVVHAEPDRPRRPRARADAARRRRRARSGGSPPLRRRPSCDLVRMREAEALDKRDV